MTEAFCAYLQARLEEATGGERYPVKGGGEASPRVVRTQLPLRSGGHDEGMQTPLVVWCITGGECSTRGLSTVEVRIDCVTWTPGGIMDGSADIMRLTNSVLALSRDTAFESLRLDSPLSWSMGMEQDTTDTVRGRQPHPYYESRIYCKFTAPGNRPRCTTSRRF